jgi:hypothetical protein
MSEIKRNDLEEAIRLTEIGEYLYSRSYSYGNGYDEPREFGIEWQWQQSKPNEFGQGALLAEAVKWHSDMAEDGISTEATKLRASIEKNAKTLEHWRQEVGKLHSQIARLRDHLDAIATYGADTLSGRVDGPSDKDWYRDGVREMRNRARAALSKEQADA